MNDVETRYTPIEKLCLSLFYICTKFEYYLLPIEILVLCKIDIVRYLLHRHVLQNWLIKWAVKSQTLEDFLAQHHCVEVQDPLVETNLAIIVKHWVLTIDGSLALLSSN
jgi:hypothetical protein